MFDQAENSTRFRLLLEDRSVDSPDEEGDSSGVPMVETQAFNGSVFKTDCLRKELRGGVGGRACVALTVSAMSSLM